jgi:hypothetical protein
MKAIKRRRPPTPRPPSTGPERTVDRQTSREAGLDRTLENTFPASDPLSTIPDPQVRSPKAPADQQ